MWGCRFFQRVMCVVECGVNSVNYPLGDKCSMGNTWCLDWWADSVSRAEPIECHHQILITKSVAHYWAQPCSFSELTPQINLQKVPQPHTLVFYPGSQVSVGNLWSWPRSEPHKLPSEIPGTPQPHFLPTTIGWSIYLLQLRSALAPIWKIIDYKLCLLVHNV